LGLTNIESYPGQKLSVEKPDVRFSHRMPAELKKEVKDKLAKSGVKMVCYGVTGLRNNEASCREVFDFAKEMGIEVIVAEPNVRSFDIVEKLCKEYNIKVAIHNHPKPSTYWSPETVLEHIQGRSELIGACADVGHWMRSGLDPVECLNKLKGRIVSLHFKDLNEFGDPNAHDVIWGSGKGNVPAMLTELKRQGGSYVFSIEYEHNWTTSMPEIKASIEYFNKTIGGL
jgi:sugar phosphate isomerase/epimerase